MKLRGWSNFHNVQENDVITIITDQLNLKAHKTADNAFRIERVIHSTAKYISIMQFLPLVLLYSKQ